MSFLLAGSTASTFAQSSGDMFVGTLLGFSVTKTSVHVGDYDGDNDPEIGLNVSPGFHYFVANNFRVGLQAELGRTSQKDNNDDKYSMNTLNIGPVAAYYIQITDRFSIAPELSFYFTHAKSKEETSHITVEDKYNGFAIGARLLNFEFRPVTHFGVSANLFGLGLVHLKQKDSDPEVSSNTFNLSLGMNPSVGVRYFF